MKKFEELDNNELCELLRLPDAFCSDENKLGAISEALARLIHK